MVFPFYAFFLSLFLFFSGCTAVNPITLKKEFNVVSEEKEIMLGRKADPQIINHFGLYNDPDLQRYVNQVGQKIAQVSDRNHLKFYFRVLDDPMVNAFALPGGYIYVTRGILAALNSEAELAGVLGHECGHVSCRHNVTQVSESMACQIITLVAIASPGSREMVPALGSLFNTIMMGYSREKEFQADNRGVEYCFKTGYDPAAIGCFLKSLARESQTPPGYLIYLVSHPDTFERVERVRARAKVLLAMNQAVGNLSPVERGAFSGGEGKRFEGIVLADVYKTHLDGLVYGSKDNPKRITIYTIQKGETIETITKKLFGDRKKGEEIAEFNGLKYDSHLYSGQKLKIIF